MNAGKCKIIISNKWEDRTAVTAEGISIEVVKDFCYLGSYISRTGSCEKECTIRIGKADTLPGTDYHPINACKVHDLCSTIAISQYT